MEILINAVGGVVPPPSDMSNRQYVPKENHQKDKPDTFEEILMKEMSK